MINQLTRLLDEHDCLYGLVCRDTTPVDVELMAQRGYHFVWLDLEHSALPLSEVVRLGRSISHLGMVPWVRIPECSRTHVQLLLDGGIEVLILPDVRGVEVVQQFVVLAKYPPLGRRGVSSTTAGTGYTLGADTPKTLSEANDATHLMALIESDEGYAALDAILDVEGLDMISVGPQDWGASLGLFGKAAAEQLGPKIEHVITAASKAGKIVVSTVSSPEEAQHHHSLGARVFVLGVDITLKRNAMAERIDHFRM